MSWPRTLHDVATSKKERKTLQCPACPQTFKDESLYKAHYEHAHGKPTEKIVKVSTGVCKLDVPRSVLIQGDVYFYNAKAPFLRSGESIKGAVEYDPTDNRVRCHECGLWFRSIGQHVRLHGITVRVYKAKHDLGATTALVSEGTREKLIAHGFAQQQHLVDARAIQKRKRCKHSGKRKPHRSSRTTEVLNAKGVCPPQVLHQLRDLGKRLGRTPTSPEIQEVTSKYNLIMSFGSVAAALRAADLVPNKGGGYGVYTAYGKDVCLRMLRQFYADHHRAPVKSDIRRGIIPSQWTLIKYFGSWAAGLKEAGIPSNRWITTLHMSDTQLLQLIKRASIILGRAPTRKDRTLLRMPTTSTYRRRFGSWERAVALAGVPVASKSIGNRCIPLPTPAQIDKFLSETT